MGRVRSGTRHERLFGSGFAVPRAACYNQGSAPERWSLLHLAAGDGHCCADNEWYQTQNPHISMRRQG